MAAVASPVTGARVATARTSSALRAVRDGARAEAAARRTQPALAEPRRGRRPQLIVVPRRRRTARARRGGIHRRVPPDAGRRRVPDPAGPEPAGARPRRTATRPRAGPHPRAAARQRRPAVAGPHRGPGPVAGARPQPSRVSSSRSPPRSWRSSASRPVARSTTSGPGRPTPSGTTRRPSTSWRDRHHDDRTGSRPRGTSDEVDRTPTPPEAADGIARASTRPAHGPARRARHRRRAGAPVASDAAARSSRSGCSATFGRSSGPGAENPASSGPPPRRARRQAAHPSGRAGPVHPAGFAVAGRPAPPPAAVVFVAHGARDRPARRRGRPAPDPGSAVYASAGQQQRVRNEILTADRGIIFDRNGEELAISVPATTFYANPAADQGRTGYGGRPRPDAAAQRDRAGQPGGRPRQAARVRLRRPSARRRSRPRCEGPQAPGHRLVRRTEAGRPRRRHRPRRARPHRHRRQRHLRAREAVRPAAQRHAGPLRAGGRPARLLDPGRQARARGRHPG